MSMGPVCSDIAVLYQRRNKCCAELLSVGCMMGVANSRISKTKALANI